jgi:hypothetical protein
MDNTAKSFHKADNMVDKLEEGMYDFSALSISTHITIEGMTTSKFRQTFVN